MDMYSTSGSIYVVLNSQSVSVASGVEAMTSLES